MLVSGDHDGRHTNNSATAGTERKSFWLAAVIAGSYLGLSVLWILLSDRLVGLIANQDIERSIQTMKGLFFVCVSSLLILLLCWRAFRSVAIGRANELVALRRARKILETVNDGIWQYDSATGDMVFGGRWSEVTGYPVLVSILYAQWKRLIHMQDLAAYDEAMARCVAGKSDVLDCEVRFSHAKGHWMWLRIVGTVLSRENKMVLLAGAVLDISASKDGAQSLSRVVDELSRSEMEVQRFAFAAAHDLREPVRQMGSYAQLLEMTLKTARGRGSDSDDITLDVATQQDVATYIGFVRDGARVLSSHLDNVLRIFEVRSLALRPDTVDLLVVIDSVLERQKALLENAQAEVICDALPVIHADRDLLATVFDNLLRNALLYRSAQRHLRINISSHRRLGAWEIKIHDNGVGFPQEKAEYIFHAFARLHANSEVPGSGMGLTMARTIIEQHGGTLTATSDGQSGATFYIVLPDSHPQNEGVMNYEI